MTVALKVKQTVVQIIATVTTSGRGINLIVRKKDWRETEDVTSGFTRMGNTGL